MKYGFIGCGNMGGAIARALSKTTTDILLSDPYAAESLAQKLGCRFGDNEQAVSCCQRLFLAVKPQILRSAIAPIADLLCKKKPVIITMAAGVKISAIEEMIGVKLPIIRIMPNTPVSVGCGTIHTVPMNWLTSLP